MYDYVVIGAGSAGCAVARRLSDDPSITVCLLEAGAPDRSPLIHVPAGVAAILPTRQVNWAFETVPQKGLNGRAGYQPRGKTLGGTSAINAMIYIRGHPSDYDHWAALGNAGWSFADVLPYFKRAQNQERGADDYHGAGGPLNVADLRSPNPVGRVFLDAARSLQIPMNADFNGATQEGVGPYQVTQRDGQRCSAAKAYLDPVRGRQNLAIVAKAQATKIVFEGRHAMGVEYRQGGSTREARAKREVILSAGALQSPQVLLLSGVGPATDLAGHGIAVVHDLPGVGRNLQDHLDFVLSYRSRSTELFGYSLAGTLKLGKAVFDYLVGRRGMLTTNYAEAGAFLKSDPTLAVPDLQLHFVVGIVDDHNRKLHWGHGYSCHVCYLHPKSRGTVALASANPLAAPCIDPNYLAEADDLERLVAGVKIMRQILEAPAFAPYRGAELYGAEEWTDDAIRAAVRARADTIYHPVGTCKMGADEMAVVDDKLRVRGLEGLRVIDASIMPTLVGGNTNAPAIMIAEKGAELIRAAA